MILMILLKSNLKLIFLILFKLQYAYTHSYTDPTNKVKLLLVKLQKYVSCARSEPRV